MAVRVSSMDSVLFALTRLWVSLPLQVAKGRVYFIQEITRSVHMVLSDCRVSCDLGAPAKARKTPPRVFWQDQAGLCSLFDNKLLGGSTVFSGEMKWTFQ